MLRLSVFASAPDALRRALASEAKDTWLNGLARQHRLDPVFGVLAPTSCPGVPSEILQPRGTWRNPNEYDAKARQLAALFQKNFATFSAQASESVRQAGPKA